MATAYGDDVARAIAEYGDDIAEIAKHYGDDVVTMAKRHFADIDEVVKTASGRVVKGSTTSYKAGFAYGKDEMIVSNSKFLNSTGDIDWEKYAPNGGYVPDTKISGQTIGPGTIIDRYGNQYGRYTSPAGVPYEQRALPYIENPNAYHQYKVLKSIDNVSVGKIASAFDQSGGGMQYELPASIKELIKKGYLKEIT